LVIGQPKVIARMMRDNGSLDGILQISVNEDTRLEIVIAFEYLRSRFAAELRRNVRGCLDFRLAQDESISDWPEVDGDGRRGKDGGNRFPRIRGCSVRLSTKSDLTIPARGLTWYIVEVTGWGAYEAGWLEIGIALVIARCVTSWQSSVEPAHCGVTGWHIRRTPRCRTVQQTPCNNNGEACSIKKYAGSASENVRK